MDTLKMVGIVGALGVGALALAACGSKQQYVPPAEPESGGSDELSKLQSVRGQIAAWNQASGNGADWSPRTLQGDAQMTKLAQVAVDNAKTGADAITMATEVDRWRDSTGNGASWKPFAITQAEGFEVMVDALERDLTPATVVRSLAREPKAYVEYARTH